MGKGSCISFPIAFAAQVFASAVTQGFPAPRCGPLFIAICVAFVGDGFMAVVSSMVLEIRFHGVFGPQFMTDLEVGSSVTSSILAVSRGFMFAVKRQWLAIDCMRMSSCGSGRRRVTLRAVV